MKTTTIRLFATMITLAAVITITSTPAIAQRRSTGRSTADSGVLKSDESRKRTVQKRSTFRQNDKVDRTPRAGEIKRTSHAQRNSKSSVSSRSRTSKASPKRVSTHTSTTTRTGRSVSGRTAPKSREGYKEKSNFRSTRSNGSLSAANRRASSKSVNSRHSTSTRTSNHRTKGSGNSYALSDSGRRETSSSSSRREKYHLNKSDKRYAPNTNYRGSNKTWSESNRPASMNYNYNSYNYYTTYNYYNQNHWNHQWENYRWNYNSWHDYYYGYNPYSYRYNQYYYYDSYYGDVIRRFVYQPTVFVHNFRRYYSYNGHFFRYYSGVGYVLVDIPFGFSFEYLPANYERVYINGYLYFRVGNLFFEYSARGFQLVHYPERYYAYDDGYQNDACCYDEW